jgi:hypothetical protein
MATRPKLRLIAPVIGLRRSALERAPGVPLHARCR